MENQKPGLLERLNDFLSPSDVQMVLASLRQEPLIWDALQNADLAEKVAVRAAGQASQWNPAVIALLAIDPQLQLEFLRAQPLQPVDNSLRIKMARLYEQIFSRTNADSQGSRPVPTLEQAGLVALTLRERRRLKKTWEGLGTELPIDNPANLPTLKTAFSCLFALSSDLLELCQALLTSARPASQPTRIAIILHAVLSNPWSLEEQVRFLTEMMADVLPEHYLDWLDAIQSLGRPALAHEVAARLLQSETCQAWFKEIQPEAYKQHMKTLSIQSSDPLNAPEAVTTVEKMQHLARLSQVAGDNETARQVLTNSWEAIRRLQARLTAQLAVNAVRSEDFVTATSAWEQVITLVPGSAIARGNLASALIQQDRMDDALAVLPENSDEPFVLLASARLAAKIGNMERAHAFTRRLLKRLPESQSRPADFNINLADLGNLLLQLDLNSEASVLMEETLAAQPARSEWLELAAQARQKLGHTAEATHFTGLAIGLQPDRIDLRRHFAGLLETQENYPAALQQRQLILESSLETTPDDLLSLAACANQAGQTDLAETTCQQILTLAPEHGPAHHLLGEALQKRGDKAAAREHFVQATLSSPENIPGWLSLATIENEIGNPQKSLETLRAAAQAVPNSSEVWLALGKASHNNGTPAEALAPLRQAYNLNPQSLDIILLLGDTLLTLGHLDEARAILCKARQTQPDHPELAYLFAQVLIALGSKREALPALWVRAQAPSQSSAPYLLFAQTLMEVFRASHTAPTPQFAIGSITAAEAITTLKSALVIEPANLEAQILLAEFTYITCQLDDAFTAFKHLAESDQAHESDLYWRVQFGLGQTALALKQIDMAVAALQEAASDRPDHIEIQQALAEAYTAARLSKEALQAAHVVVQLAPQSLDILLWFSQLMGELNMRTEAVNALTRATELAPQRTDLLLWLGQVCFEAGQPVKARQSLDQFLSKPAATRDELHAAGLLLSRLNDLPAAISTLEKAAAKSTSLKVTLIVDLALAHLQAGDAEKALEELQPAIDSFPNDLQVRLTQANLLEKLHQARAALTCLELVLQLITSDEQLQETGQNIEEAPLPLSTVSPFVANLDASAATIHTRLAYHLRLAGDFITAIIHAEQALQLRPDSLEALYLVMDLAASSLDQARLETHLSKESLNKIIARPVDSVSLRGNPYLVGLLSERTEFELEQKNIAAAKATLAALNTLFPEDIFTLCLQARFAFKDNKIEQADQIYTRIAEMFEKTAEILPVEGASPVELHERSLYLHRLLSLAETALTLQHWPAAISLFQKAAAFAPLGPRPQLRLARALTLRAEQQQLCQALKVLAHAPGTDTLGRSAYKLFEEAILTASRLTDSSLVTHWRDRGQVVFYPSPQTAASLASHESLTEDDAAALLAAWRMVNNQAEARRIMQAYASSREVQLQWALFLMESKSNQASAAATALVEGEPANPLLHALVSYTADGETLALQAIEAALSYWPDEAFWHHDAAMLCYRNGDQRNLVRHLEQAAALMPDDYSTLIELGQSYLNNGDVLHAIQTLEHAAQIDSTREEAWLFLAQAYLQANDLQQAQVNAERAANIAPSSVEAHILLGEVALRQGNHEMAITRAMEVHAISPAEPQATLLHARAEAARGNVKRALEVIEETLPYVSDTFPLQMERARLIKQAQGSQAALPYLEEMVNANPEEPELLANLAIALAEAGQLDGAENAAQASIYFKPEQPHLFLLLGRIQRKKGELSQAIQNLEEAIRLVPDVLEPVLELGRTYQDGREYLKALQAFQRGTEIAPNDPRSFYQAAIVMKENKDFIGAEAMLRRASKLAPDDVNIRRQLGTIITLNLVHNSKETLNV